MDRRRQDVFRIFERDRPEPLLKTPTVPSYYSLQLYTWQLNKAQILFFECKVLIKYSFPQINPKP